MPEETLKAYSALVATLEGVEVKGASMPYTSLNGNMFSFLSPDGALNLRLPADAREKLIAEHKAALTIQHGAVLKEYVAIPAALFNDKRQMRPLMKASFAYAATLKPKPTKRGKS